MKGCSSFAIIVDFLGMIYDTVLNILVKQKLGLMWNVATGIG